MTVIISSPITTSDEEEHAFTTTNNNEVVINLSSLTTSGNLANGILADANKLQIVNFGSIATSGFGAAGIFAKGQDIRVENYGSVTTTGDLTPDELFFSEGIFVAGNRYYIANYGTVRVDGESASALVGDGTNGLIINYGVAESTSTNSSVIAAVGNNSKAINEVEGVVRVTSEGSDEGNDNALMFVLGNNASALNLGLIEGTGTGNIGMEGVIVGTHLTNEGIISLTGDNSIGMAGFGDAHQLSNFGDIETNGTFAFGMAVRGGGLSGKKGLNLEVLNADDGHIVTNGAGAIGIALGVSALAFRPAEGGLIENDGVIETQGDGAAGVLMSGDGHHLINSWQITSDGGIFSTVSHGDLSAAGVVVSGDDVWVTNTLSGEIVSQNAASAAVELNVLERDGLPAANNSSLLENFGLIQGADLAVLGGAGQEHVINFGHIDGDVDLGAGNDEFVAGNGGVLNGDLSIGDGDDLVLIENGSGATRIADFVAGDSSGDVVDVSAFFSSLAELIDASSQSDNDVEISLDQNDTLVLVGVQLSTLNADDFWFA